MDYIEVDYTSNGKEEYVGDLVIASLGDLGFDSFVNEESSIKAYINVDLYRDDLLDSMVDDPLVGGTFIAKKIESQNWNSEWEQNQFQPISIDQQLVIRAPYHTGQFDHKYQIVIEPNMSFGTGDHQTTAMILSELSQLDLSGVTSLLDMGCGTGVLGIYAALIGVKSVEAIDIDNWSYEATEINTKLNGVDKQLTVKLGDADLLSDQKFDMIIANIHKNILVRDLPKYCSVLNPKGSVVLSGFLKGDIEDMETAAKLNNLELEKTVLKDDWTVLIFRSII